MPNVTIGLVLLFFPGIVCAILIENLTATREWGALRFSLYSLVSGVVCYLVYAVGLALWTWAWGKEAEVAFLKALTDPGATSYTEIALVTGVSILVGTAASWALNHYWPHKVMRAMGVTKKFGALDVWGHVFNSDDVKQWFVTVRDRAANLAYQGWVDAFSDCSDQNEILLKEVRVFVGTTSELLYTVDAIYLTRNKSDLTIEFAAPVPNTGDQSDADK